MEIRVHFNQKNKAKAQHLHEPEKIAVTECSVLNKNFKQKHLQRRIYIKKENLLITILL